MFSGDGLADSPVCNRSRTTIWGCARIGYRRLRERLETSAARSKCAPGRETSLLLARSLRLARSLPLTHLGNRGPALRLQSQANPALERIAIAVGRHTLTLAVGVDLEEVFADPRGEKQVAHRIGPSLRELHIGVHRAARIGVAVNADLEGGRLGHRLGEHLNLMPDFPWDLRTPGSEQHITLQPIENLAAILPGSSRPLYLVSQIIEPRGQAAVGLRQRVLFGLQRGLFSQQFGFIGLQRSNGCPRLGAITPPTPP